LDGAFLVWVEAGEDFVDGLLFFLCFCHILKVGFGVLMDFGSRNRRVCAKSFDCCPFVKKSSLNLILVAKASVRLKEE
jgi:hypothetical protein